MKSKKSKRNDLRQAGAGFRVVEEARRLTNKVFAEAHSPESPSRLVGKLVSLADALVEQEKERNPPQSQIMCRAGCAHCCHMRVLVTAPEALILAEFIRENLSPNELSDIKKKIGQTSELAARMTDAEYSSAGLACPLLVDSMCSVYEARPMECRGYVSMSVEACERAADNYDDWNVPVYLEQYSIFKNVQIGLLHSMAISDLPCELLEMSAALTIALDTPDAADRWLAGENVFGSAAIRSDDPEAMAIQPWSPTFWS